MSKQLRDDEIPCVVCGEPLTVQNSKDWAMGCSGYSDAKGPPWFKPGRSLADYHYSRSRIEFGNAENAEKYALRLTIQRLKVEIASLKKELEKK